MADRSDLEEEEEAIKKSLVESDTDNDDEVVKRDYYFDEALAIAIDYAALLETGHFAAIDNNPLDKTAGQKTPRDNAGSPATKLKYPGYSPGKILSLPVTLRQR